MGPREVVIGKPVRAGHVLVPDGSGGWMQVTGMTAAAIKGYYAETDATMPGLATSPNWYAWKLGAYFRATGHTQPWDVRMGRGDRIHASGMLFKIARGAIFTRER